MTRGLYGWIYRTLTDCIPFRTLLDTEGGLRRMDHAKLAEYQVIVSFGAIIRGPVTGYAHIPLEFQTVEFSIWVRPEVPEPGDLVLEDIQDRLMRALVWRQPANPIPGQNCVGTTPDILIMDAEHLDGDTRPEFDDNMQAWTKTIPIRFLVMLATCQEAQEWCGNCDPEPVETSGESPIVQGTFFNQVTQGNEGTVGDFDGYISNPVINEALLEANAPSDSLKLFQCVCSLMPRYDAPYFAGQRAVTTEADYWHSGFPATEANRIEKDADVWHIRPSADLGDRIAAYLLGATSLYFDGAMADEAGHLEDHYFNAYKLVHPDDNGGVALTDADRPYWNAQWELMHDAFFQAMKAGFGTARALIANSGGVVRPGLDGITVEEAWAVLLGEAVVIARLNEQQIQWLASSNRFGEKVLNILWNHSLTAAAPVYLGTDIGS